LAIKDYRGDSLRVPPEEWLALLDREYLSDYIPSGGSVVRFVSGSPETLQSVERAVKSNAERYGFHYAGLDPASLNEDGKKLEVHRIDKLFFEVTREVDWKSWTASHVREYLERQSIKVGPDRRLNDLDGIAADNERDATDLLGQFQSHYATPLIRDNSQEIEFRTALTALSRAQVVPDAVSPTTEDVVLGWFTGRPGLSRELKKLHIYNRIDLSNARHMLASFCKWLPRVGRSGLVIVLNFQPYEFVKKSVAQRRVDTLDKLREAITRGGSQEELSSIMAEGDADPPINYSPIAYNQMLQLLRRFIDEIEGFERFCLVVLTSPEYYDRASERNYYNYDALQTRIGLEVHDSNRANAVAALVHLEEDR
jgi:hypothetical protein